MVEFNNVSLVRKETGYKAEDYAFWTYAVNLSSILDTLMREAARCCEHYLSDLFISWQSLQDMLDQPHPIEKTRLYFGFRDCGVDNETFMQEKLDDPRMYGEHPYRAIYYIDVEADEQDIKVELYRAEDDRYLEPFSTKPPVRQEDRLELIGQMVDIFEDFLEEKGIDIPNEEKEEAEDGCAAIIYGSDFDILENSIDATLRSWGLLAPHEDESIGALIDRNAGILLDVARYVKTLVAVDEGTESEHYKTISEAYDLLKKI